MTRIDSVDDFPTVVIEFERNHAKYVDAGAQLKIGSVFQLTSEIGGYFSDFIVI